MNFYYLSTLLALPTLILCESPPLPVCKDVVGNCASLLASCDNVAMQRYCQKSCGVCEYGPKPLLLDNYDTSAECTDGETKTAEDGCNTCTCVNGEWGPCTLMACPEKLPECTDGETKTADDGCNGCTCMNGDWGCTLMLCSEELPEDVPKLDIDDLDTPAEDVPKPLLFDDVDTSAEDVPKVFIDDFDTPGEDLPKVIIDDFDTPAEDVPQGVIDYFDTPADLEPTKEEIEEMQALPEGRYGQAYDQFRDHCKFHRGMCMTPTQLRKFACRGEMATYKCPGRQECCVGGIYHRHD